ncbi:hypothetical protein OIE68_20885 [Nocardia vinacea]|uniref:hypothetical protein n=1 Tax=Nocardia vinacea TaxID=96468 RepID=UPI002E11D209|nr:hypothetical protein OIE68_20885 [Nocardia vinacea]
MRLAAWWRELRRTSRELLTALLELLPLGRELRRACWVRLFTRRELALRERLTARWKLLVAHWELLSLRQLLTNFREWLPRRGIQLTAVGRQPLRSGLLFGWRGRRLRCPAPLPQRG